jgi:hypothetical protein
MSTRRIKIAVIAVLGVSVAAAAAYVTALHAGEGRMLVPSAISALSAEATKVSGTPQELEHWPSQHKPTPGSVHGLGKDGSVYAWESGGKVCWDAGQVGGCLAPLQIVVDWVIHDPDTPGRGAPTAVSGLAIDGVRSVTAELRDGRSVTVTPVKNFYTATLPADAMPWDVKDASAQLIDGSKVNYPIEITPP